MKFSSLVYAQTSGSVGGLTYAHNKGGLYTRARRVPVNPNSAQQSAVRDAVSAAVGRWTNTLTDAQRAAWETYAANVPLLDALGMSRNVSGINMYVRSNVPRIQVGLSPVDAGPTTFSLPDLTLPTYVVNAGADTVAVSYTNTDGWATAVGGALLIYASRQQSPTINFFAGPYRFAGRVNGAATPPTSPATITLPFAADSGNKVFFRAEATEADGRLSSSFRGFDVA